MKKHGRSSCKQALTDVLDCLHEPGADVGFVVVLHGDALVLVVPLEVVGAVGGDVEQRRDAQRVERVPPRGVVGAAKVEEGKDFYGATLLERKTAGERGAGHNAGWGRAGRLKQDPIAMREGKQGAGKPAARGVSGPTWSWRGVPQELKPKSRGSALLRGEILLRVLVLAQNSGYSEAKRS